MDYPTTVSELFGWLIKLYCFSSHLHVSLEAVAFYEINIGFGEGVEPAKPEIG